MSGAEISLSQSILKYLYFHNTGSVNHIRNLQKVMLENNLILLFKRAETTLIFYHLISHGPLPVSPNLVVWGITPTFHRLNVFRLKKSYFNVKKSKIRQ